MRHLFRRLFGLFSGPTSRPAGTCDADAAAPPRDIKVIPRKLHDAPNTCMFSLTAIRTRLGERWEQYAPSVHRIAQRVIFSGLDGKGSFERFGDTYILTFDRLRGNRARLEGDRLHTRFMELLSKGGGTDNAIKSREKAAHPPASRDGLLRRLVQRVKALFRRHREQQIAENPSEPDVTGDEAIPPPQEAPAVVSSARSIAAPAARAVRTRKFKPLPEAADVLSARRSPHRPDRSLENLRLPREARAIENAIALSVLQREAQSATPNGAFPPPDLSFIYRSMWNLRTRYLTTYTSVPICWKSSLQVHHGEKIVPVPRRPKHLFELDMLCLENTIDILTRLTRQKRPVLFMNVVHAATLADKDTAGEYLTLIESIPQAACRQLLFEIVDIADFAHHAAAFQMVKYLLPSARAVTASVTLQDRNFAFWKQCGFMAVGADISRERCREEEVIACLDQFAAQAKRHRLVSYLRELDTYSLTLSAAGAGFDFLEGAVVGSSDHPDNLALSRFNVENLYDDAMEVVPPFRGLPSY